MPTAPDRAQPFRGPAPGRVAPAQQPRDTFKDGDRQVAVDPLYRPMITGPAPGMFAPSSFPPDRLAALRSTTVIPDPLGASWIPIVPPGHLSPMTSRDNGIAEAASRTPAVHTFYVSKSTTASAANGGSSPTIRSSGSDGVVSAAFPERISSLTATWSANDVGHTIAASTGNTIRRITGFTPGRTLSGVTTTSGNALGPAGTFLRGCEGQIISGTNFQTNTSIASVSSDGSQVSLSLTTLASSATSCSLAPMLSTEASASAGNNTFAAGVGASWTVGGPWALPSTAVALTSGANVIQGGDTIYIGAGVYRGTVTVPVQFAPDYRTVNFIGDVDGAILGTPGEVRITGYSNDLQNSTANALTMQGGSYTSWSNIVFEAASSGNTINGQNALHDITWTDCAVISGFAGTWTLIACADRPANFTLERCIVLGFSNPITFTLPTSTLADYDANILVSNCVIMSFGGVGLSLTASGANAFKGGGMRVRNCTFFASATGCNTASSGVSSSIQTTIYDSLFACGSVGISGNNAGQIVEDYNMIQAPNPRAGTVPTGPHSISSAFFSRLGLHMGQERIWGATLRAFGTPTADNYRVGGFGSQSATSLPVPSPVDFLTRPRPSGVGHALATGTATSATTTTLTDSTATWPANANWGGATLKITGGLGAGQLKIIKSHTSTALTVYSPWVLIPDATSTYSIYFGAPAETVAALNGGTTTTMINNSANWDANVLVGFSFVVLSGTCVGQTGTVNALGSNTVTFTDALTTAPTSTSVFKFFRGTDENSLNRTVGAIERHDVASKETFLTDAGGVGWRIFGYGDQELRFAVNAESTTISVKCSWDTDHGDATKPQIQLVANGTIGVTAQTVTAVGTAGSGTFETLSLATFTPTAKGVVAVRLCGRSTLPTGRAVFDTVSIA